MSISSMTYNSSGTPVRFRIGIGGLIASLSLLLLSIVDIRRGFLFLNVEGFGEYFSRSPYHVLGAYNIIMLVVGAAGLFYFYKLVKNIEAELTPEVLERYVKISALIIFAILVVDLFTY
ncbi:MAG: hypothetical protein OEV06_12335, partial [Anaerolineae bacterium]|nr:hypothetical protein [Anaerolineae bacterium]